MTDDLQELLSAYLDGELTSDEQARVEQQLAEDAEYRQLHDEMRALRSSFELLPRHRLHDDIGRSVIRKAERAILSAPRNGSQENGSPAGAATAASKTDAAGEKVARQWRIPSRRAVLYPLAALAACLLIMFFSNVPRGPEDPVAKNPDAKTPEGIAGPEKVDAASPEKAPQVAGGVAPGTEPGTTLIDGNPAAVPDPRMIVSVPRGANAPNKAPLLPEKAPGSENTNLVGVDPDDGKPAIERALSFANELSKPLAGALMVVQCKATQEALDIGAIDLILARHNITVTAAGEKPAADAKSIDLPKLAIDLDLVYVEATAAEAAAIIAEIQAQNHHFPTMRFGLAPDEESRANQVSQQINTPGQVEEARGNAAARAAQIPGQEPKIGTPDEKQLAGEEKTPGGNAKEPKVANAAAPEPWRPRAHRLKLGAAKEKEKTAVIARHQAPPAEPAVRVLFLLRAAESTEIKK